MWDTYLAVHDTTINIICFVPQEKNSRNQLYMNNIYFFIYMYLYIYFYILHGFIFICFFPFFSVPFFSTSLLAILGQATQWQALSFVHGSVCSFILLGFLSFYSRTYIQAKKNSFRYNLSFSHLAFLSLLVHSLVRWNGPPLSRSFSRAHSSSAEINLMFSRISGLLISPPLIYRRRPRASPRIREAESQAPRMFRWHLSSGQPRDPKRVSLGFPWFSAPPVSIWLDDSRSLRGDYRSCQRIIGRAEEAN